MCYVLFLCVANVWIVLCVCLLVLYSNMYIMYYVFMLSAYCTHVCTCTYLMYLLCVFVRILLYTCMYVYICIVVVLQQCTMHVHVRTYVGDWK